MYELQKKHARVMVIVLHTQKRLISPILTLVELNKYFVSINYCFKQCEMMFFYFYLVAFLDNSDVNMVLGKRI